MKKKKMVKRKKKKMVRRMKKKRMVKKKKKKKRMIKRKTDELCIWREVVQEEWSGSPAGVRSLQLQENGWCLSALIIAFCDKKFKGCCLVISNVQ